MTVGVCARNEVKPNSAVRRTNIAAFVPHLDGHFPYASSSLPEQRQPVNICKNTIS